ncbi:MAG: hypothetical protein ACYTF6_06095 [Planctomycetota bacterium]|jgi:hypothetical protein
MAAKPFAVIDSYIGARMGVDLAARSCAPGNLASIATARSVGFVPYARTLILSAPAQ